MDEKLKAYLKERLDKHIDLIPEHMRDSIYGYVMHGLEPGSFLTAVLCNDLKGAVGSADHINQAHIVQWAQFMMWAMPRGAQGSSENVNQWILDREMEREGILLPNDRKLVDESGNEAVEFKD